jgi:hypothetical protein
MERKHMKDNESKIKEVENMFLKNQEQLKKEKESQMKEY